MRSPEGRSTTPVDTWLEGLFEAYFAHVLAYALRRTAERADAEDIVADTFVTAWRRRDQVPDAAALPWLYAVARKLIANQRRSRDRRTRLLSRLSVCVSPTPQAAPQTDQVLAALERLPADDRELLRLVAWEELRHAEVGHVLGITPNAVAIRLHRARARLQRELNTSEAPRKGSNLSRTLTSWKDSRRGHPGQEAK